MATIPKIPNETAEIVNTLLAKCGTSIEKLMQPQEAPDEAWTLNQAAKFLGMSKRSIQRLIKQGVIQAKRIGKRAVRLSSNDVRSLIH